MTILESIRTCLAKWRTLDGRASRSEYWWFQLFTMLFYIACSVTAGLSMEMLANGPVILAELSPSVAAIGLVPNILLLLLLPALVCAQVRRLRDSGHSGLWTVPSLVLLLLGAVLQDIPEIANIVSAAGLLSGLILLTFLCAPSRPITQDTEQS